MPSLVQELSPDFQPLRIDYVYPKQLRASTLVDPARNVSKLVLVYCSLDDRWSNIYETQPVAPDDEKRLVEATDEAERDEIFQEIYVPLVDEQNLVATLQPGELIICTATGRITGTVGLLIRHGSLQVN